jgi:tRNA nucleotidyltransferase (CCA-adding enzyme)
MNLKVNLNKLPKDIRDLIRLSGEVAQDRKDYVYLVGGIVRDLLLGVPNYDLDVVIQGDGLGFASELSRRINARLTKHPQFKTATLITSENRKMDVATCRCEIYPEPASLPVVSPGTIKEDLLRRDFTINALAVDLLPENFGKLVDFYQGGRDLNKRFIRILHDMSFIDDPTRIIRAVRFEQRLKFRIEPHSLKLLKQAVSKGMLRRLSPHRLRDEIILILKEPRAINCILRLKKLVGFDFIHHQLKLSKANLVYLNVIKKEIDWFKGNFPKYRVLDTWLMYFIGLLANLNEDKINQVYRRFGVRRGEIKKIISFRRFPSQKVSLLSKKNIRPSRIYRILKPLSFEVILLIKARFRNNSLDHNIEQFFKYYNEIQLYIRGKDLTALGLEPNPDYKKILTHLLYLQLDGKITSRHDALKKVKKWLSFS